MLIRVFKVWNKFNVLLIWNKFNVWKQQAKNVFKVTCFIWIVWKNLFYVVKLQKIILKFFVVAGFVFKLINCWG